MRSEANGPQVAADVALHYVNTPPLLSVSLPFRRIPLGDDDDVTGGLDSRTASGLNNQRKTSAMRLQQRRRTMDSSRQQELIQSKSVDHLELVERESSPIVVSSNCHIEANAKHSQPTDTSCYDTNPSSDAAKTLNDPSESERRPTSSVEENSCRKYDQATSNKQRQAHRGNQASTFNKQFAMQSIHSLSMQLGGQQHEMAPMGSPLGALSSASGDGLAAAANAQQQLGTGYKFSRLVGKKAARLKEIVLQNLGRADRTNDELFQIYEENFYKQQAQALKLQKEFKAYVNSLKGAQEASKSLNNCIQHSTGEYQSARHDLVCENLNQLGHLSDDLMEKLRDQIVVGINEYLSQFGEMRDKIAKRRRKLIDYDSSRRIYELMVNNMNKKRIRQQQQQGDGAAKSRGATGLRSAFSFSGSSSNLNGSSLEDEQQGITNTSQLLDEARLLKMREQFNYCKIMYETINSELHEELPMIYEKKMKHLLITLQNYFSLEAQFSLNAGKLYATISDVVDELPMSIVNARSNQLHAHGNNYHHVRHHHHHRHDHLTHLSHAEADSAVEQAAIEQNAIASTEDELPSGYGKSSAVQTSGGASSSGMGSSRGDSSMESSSSPDNSIGNGDHQSGERQQQQQVEESSSGNGPQAGSSDSGASTSEGASQEEEVETKGQLGEAPAPSEAGNYCGAQIAEDNRGAVQSLAEGLVKVAIAEAEATPVASRVYNQTDIGKKKGLIVVDGVAAGEQAGDFLYKVETHYKYLAEDVDELCFEAGEIIQVVALDEGHEPEEGWLMGVREVNGQKGLFPANFTRPL